MSNLPTSVAPMMVGGQILGQLMEQPRPAGAEAVAKVMSAPVRPSASAVQEAQPMREAVANALVQIESFVREMDRDFNFVKDEVSGYIVVSVIDPQTGEVIRRLPGDEILRLARTIEQMGNMLVSQKA